MMGKVNEYEKEYEQVILRGSINTCQPSKGKFGNFLVQMIDDSIKKFTNYSYHCPVKQGLKEAKNLPLEFDYIPSYFMGTNRKWEFTSTTKAKISNKKPLMDMFSIKFLGEFVN